MKRTSWALASRHFASVAALILGACGSDGYQPTPPVITPLFYAYITSAGTSAGTPGTVYEYTYNDDYSVSPLSQASIAAGVYPAAIILNQGNVYVVNAGDGTISQYMVTSVNTLTAMNPAIVANPGMHTLGAAPASAVIDATGSYLYVVNTADSTLSQFNIGADGQLSPMTPPTVTTGVAPVSIVPAQVSGTSAQYYYVLNSGVQGAAGNVSIYAMSGQNGALTLIDSVAAGTNPTSITVNNIASAVYVMNTCATAQCSGTIQEFTIGANAALADTGVTVSTGNSSVSMILNENTTNSYAYVISNGVGADASAGTLWQYSVQSGGDLTSLSPPSVSVGSAAISQDFEVNLLFVLTANASGGGNIDSYAFATGGLLSLNGTATIDAPHPTNMAVHQLLAP